MNAQTIADLRQALQECKSDRQAREVLLLSAPAALEDAIAYIEQLWELLLAFMSIRPGDYDAIRATRITIHAVLHEAGRL